MNNFLCGDQRHVTTIIINACIFVFTLSLSVFGNTRTHTRTSERSRDRKIIILILLLNKNLLSSFTRQKRDLFLGCARAALLCIYIILRVYTRRDTIIRLKLLNTHAATESAVFENIIIAMPV